ncbi:arsenite efflux transporter metallochaperone ArsD [Salisediminibacterium halotolerans]|uniref:Arsenical resistance operon trans-acting repressor ArsD n=1 Tax=Salisediminibacterium halotolerans TaxID=517425 RepID=A0A1H9RC43_9BACI|nr:arsenite efflux transporter metallochaperone ArsD [Salisediminibacterium haloalkalitolerans]SER70115.1 Arsenical resistance operon trans-acting repressor ArsD [Salisediminibacterium haloalkalitolerans]
MTAKTIEIFDPALCCPTGVCGPGVDPELTRIARMVSALTGLGYEVKRYNLAQEAEYFTKYQAIHDLLEKDGPDGLPAVVVDGELVIKQRYPTKTECAEWLGLSEAELEEKTAKPKQTINLTSL